MVMVLFLVFVGFSEVFDGGSFRKELDWLSNLSFCVGFIMFLS